MVFIAFALFLIAGPLLAAPDDGALTAYNRKDYATAFRIWEACAQKGVASCKYDLGLMYLSGEGRRVNVGAALDWLSQAAGQGDANSQNKLGLLYFRSDVVSEDNARAMAYFMAAAWHNQAPGQANVGLMHWKGFGVPVDLVEAFAWSELSTERLPSGAKQRDEILKQLTPDQWSKGRDRAAALRKEIAARNRSTGDLWSVLSVLVSLLSVVLLIGFFVWRLARKKLAPHEVRRSRAR